MRQTERTRHQRLPTTGAAREALREKGQFWTPLWVAEAMVGYAIAGGADGIFDPAVGGGAFFSAAKSVAGASNRPIQLRGTEIDPSALVEALRHGLSDHDLSQVVIADFLSWSLPPAEEGLPAIVANPPYIRHHRLPPETKAELRAFGHRLIGTALDGRAGYHVYFLLRALTLLAPNGRLAFIMPADTVEGVFATVLWRWITAHFRLDAVITFAPEATPFPGVDTNAVIFFIRNADPEATFWWARCLVPDDDALVRWASSAFAAPAEDVLRVTRRAMPEALATGLSRPPVDGGDRGPTLANYATVKRGIATGANEFFFLTRTQAASLGLPQELFVRAIGRTRDLLGDGDTISDETLDRLDALGRPTILFSPDGRRLDVFPEAVQRYMAHGESLGLPDRPLIGQRRPWYKMERRTPPPFLFAYLGRRNARFIRNLAGVVPLTGFLCVYPRPGIDHDALWSVLQHEETVANLARVGKSYGGGALKVEPRALDRLPLPPEIVAEARLPHAEKVHQVALLPA